MEIGRDRGHAGDSEVEGRDGIAGLAHGRGEDAADAGVDMEPEVVGFGDRAEGRDGVDESERIGRGRGVEADRVLREGRFDGGGVGAVVRADGDAFHREAEEVGGFVQSRVGGVWSDDLRAHDAGAVGASPFAGGVDGDEDALRATGREDAGGFVVAGEQAVDDGEHLALHAADAGKDADAKTVFDHVHAEGFAQDVFEIVAGVPHVGSVATVTPVEVVVAHGDHLLADFAPCSAVGGEIERHFILLSCDSLIRSCVKQATQGRKCSRAGGKDGTFQPDRSSW